MKELKVKYKGKVVNSFNTPFGEFKLVEYRNDFAHFYGCRDIVNGIKTIELTYRLRNISEMSIELNAKYIDIEM
jgi:hypothetical protein